MLGLLEFGIASGDKQCLAEAADLFWKIVAWIDDPTLIGRVPSPPGSPRVSQLANEMVLMGMAMELLDVQDDPRVRAVLAGAVRNTKLHFDRGRRVLMELAPLDGSDLRSSPEGRLCSPGHSVELAWFLLHALDYLPADAECRRIALETIEGSMEFGWDPEFGGLYYLLDIENKPMLPLEHFMKLWWVQIEAIYALVLAYTQTRDARWLPWLDKLTEYTWRLCPDPQYGEWLGYFDRQGNVTHTCKGGNYKGFYHLPRFLMMTAQLIEKHNKS
jgi:N-acylglucosamine 2-epimerase